MSDELTIYFILPNDCVDEEATSKEMQEAFELSRQQFNSIEWLAESQCTSSKFEKNDVIVFQKFEGKAYESLSSQKCLRVIGPWCLITSLSEKIEIPNNGYSIFNLSMAGLTICMTNLPPELKRKLQEKILCMGAVVKIHVTSNTTHLIANTVTSTKYIAAKEQGISVMLDTWIDAVWNASLTKRTVATDVEFDKYKCRTFQNLSVSASGLTADQRNIVQKLLEENGGKFNPKMSVTNTHMLICKQGIHSEKFLAARKNKIPCVTMDWVTDSIEKGYALRENNYKIYGTSSTPNKLDIPNLDFSTMSSISTMTSIHPKKQNISDTILTDLSRFSLTLCKSPTDEVFSSKAYQEVIDQIDMRKVKLAGPFLDGCIIYLSGFSTDAREKLCRILKSGGATRYDDISDRITHVISADPNAHDLRLFAMKDCHPPMVTVNWLLESIYQKQPASEDIFLIKVRQPSEPGSSPLSKKGLSLLRTDTSLVETEVPNINLEQADQIESKVMQQYMLNDKTENDTLAQLIAQAASSKLSQEDNTKPTSKQTEEDDDDDDVSDATSGASLNPIFSGKTFILLNFDQETYKKLSNCIEDLQGEVKSSKFKGIADYTVVPVISKKIHYSSAEVVTNLWIIDCFEENRQVEYSYHHQPVYCVANSKPLKGCVISVSGYYKTVKDFLSQLIVHLGGIYQEKFSRITSSDKSVCASTHLISSTPVGNKYAAALKWNIPVVSPQWLIHVAEKNERLSEEMCSIAEKLPINDSDMSCTLRQSILENAKTGHNGTNKEMVTLVNERQNKSRHDIGDINEPGEKRKKLTTMKNSEVPSTSKQSVLENVDTENRKTNNEMITPVHDRRSRSRCGSGDSNEPSEKRRKPSSFGSGSDDVFCPPVQSIRENVANISISEKVRTQSEDYKMKVDDGRRVSMDTYLSELRKQGVFDPPSPAPPCESPSIVDKMTLEMMERGLISSNKNVTPKRQGDNFVGFSQDTPVANYLKLLHRKKIISSSNNSRQGSPQKSNDSLSNMTTPETPIGRFLGSTPSPQTRKYWKRYLSKMPERSPNTPMSKIKRQVFEKFLSPNTLEEIDKKYGESQELESEEDEGSNFDSTGENKELEETDSQKAHNIQAHNKLQKFENAMKLYDSTSRRRSLLNVNSSGSSTPKTPTTNTLCLKYQDAKESQNDTVGWEDPLESVIKKQIGCVFMLSGIEKRIKDNYIQAIKSMGGEFSEIEQYNPKSTHLVCLNPSRNEKILASVAAGKWVVHASYILESNKVGMFLDEELYEFGNPKALEHVETVSKTGQQLNYMYWWRKRIHEQKCGAFNKIRAFIFSSTNDGALHRLVEAGGGTVIPAKPPFQKRVEATHCFIDPKDGNPMKIFEPLAKQGVFCVNVTYLAAFLHSLGEPDLTDFIPSELKKYYE